MARTATVDVQLTEVELVQRVFEAAADLAEVALECAGSLEASENMETPRYVAEELRSVVADFKKAFSA